MPSLVTGTRAAFCALAALLLAACKTPEPAFVSKADLDRAHTTGDITTLCVGLKMKDDDTREHAAQILKDLKDPGVACICDHLTRDGAYDPAVYNGLANPDADGGQANYEGCVAKALDDTALKDRAGMATAMLKVKTSVVHERLVKAAESDADPEVQAAALPALRATKDPKELQMLMDGLKRGGTWGANAALDLDGNPAAKEALKGAIQTGDAPTKAAALTGYRDTHAEDWPAVACAAMDDADPVVRAAVATAIDATRSPQILGCVADHLKKLEPDANVRLSLLTMLSKDAAPEAAKALCDAVPFWVKSYVTDTAPTEKSDADILFYQNDRDFDASLACATAAFNASGYTTCGKAYLGARVNEYGGKVHYTACKAPGDAAAGGGKGVGAGPSGGGGGGGATTIEF